jgi:hypothetical protein
MPSIPSVQSATSQLPDVPHETPQAGMRAPEQAGISRPSAGAPEQAGSSKEHPPASSFARLPARSTPRLRDYARSLLQRGWTAEQVRAALGLTRRQIDHLLTPLSDPAAIPDDPFSRARRAARRCPGCGGLVFQWPCLTCIQRERMERETELRRAA